MSHAIPPVGHPARDMFDIRDLVAIGTGERPPLVDIWRAKRLARDLFARNPAACRACYIVLRADDRLDLVSVGRRGGHRIEWRFGAYRAPR